MDELCYTSNMDSAKIIPYNDPQLEGRQPFRKKNVYRMVIF